jgi:hypothetical protein
VQIFGYPKQEFPPTDFHTASLVGDEIYIVGSLGDPDDRQNGVTSSYVLDTKSYAIREVTPKGDGPGWLHQHNASYDSELNAITVTGGEVWDSRKEPQYLENINDYRLHLSGLRWERLTDRKWQRFEFFRPDGDGLGMMDEPKWTKHLEDAQNRLRDGLGTDPSPETLENIQGMAEKPDALDLIWPDIDHEKIPRPETTDDDEDSSDNEFKTRRIKIAETTIRYVQDFGAWILVIEGELDEDAGAAQRADLKEKLAKHFEAEVQWRKIGDS